MDTSIIEKQIKEIEDEIFKTQKNKSTEHHIGKLKAKIAKLRFEIEKRKRSAVKGKGFVIKKSGNASVGLIGFPSTGKSTLMNRLTDAKSRVGSYDFTTLNIIPGIMNYKGADIQFLDLPGLITGASEGKGRGREILSAIRNVDLILLMVDAQHNSHLEIMTRELYKAGIRLNQKLPDIVVKKTIQGGINVTSTIKLSYISEELIKSISSQYFINADIIIREDIIEDQLIDVYIGNRVYVPAIVIINKTDLIQNSELTEQISKIKGKNWNVIGISALENVGLQKLKEMIFNELNLIRVFMKPVGKQVDFEEPLILKQGSSVEDVCKKLHRDFKNKFRYATVTGPSAKHSAQKVGLNHKLKDKDILTIFINR